MLSRSRTVLALSILALVAALTMTAAHAVGETSGGVFVPVTPTRIVDTESGVGGSEYPLGPLAIRSYEVLGSAGVPSNGVSAVVVDITVTNASAATTNLTLWPNGEARPEAVTMYYSGENSARSNTAIVKVGTGGKISVRNFTGNTDINLDIQGYFTDASDESSTGGFVPITPKRVANSITGEGVPQGKLPGEASIDIQVSNDVEIPDDATAVFANIEVRATDSGELIIVKGGESASNVPAAVTYQGNGPTTSGVMLRMSSDGKIRMHNNSTGLTSGDIDFKVDIQGYFSGHSSEGGSYTPLTPDTIYESTATGNTPLAGGETRTIPVGGLAGIPDDGIASAAALTITVQDWTSSGSLTAYNSEEDQPATTNLSFVAGEGEPSNGSTVTAIVSPSEDGDIKLHNSSGASITVYVTSQGWFTEGAEHDVVAEEVPDEPPLDDVLPDEAAPGEDPEPTTAPSE